ncbi:AI-2E family transporter [Micromonospora polyrhachis]|uniref:Putative PurR-regulated permease PerM n=1 Tax=Micromonospora polyrhachis TaxID=1282883 RepID=A0A7W7SRI0_9ACTN|nr:putative PurR-regulated permease PerM [Micromonospora polyrhachis]
MSRFEQLWARVRRAYQSSRGSVQNAAQARRQIGASSTDGPLPATLEGAESSLADAEPPAEVHPSTSSRDDADVPHGLRIAAAWAWRLGVIGVVGWALIEVIGTIRIVVIPLAIAMLLSALLAPAVGWLLRARFPRSLATALVLVTGLAAVIGTLTLVVNEFIRGVPALSKDATKGVRQIQDWLKTGPLHLSDRQLNQYIDQGQKWVDENTQSLTNGALSTATTVFEVLTGSLLVLFATFFFLRDGGRIWKFLVRLLPSVARWRVHEAGKASWETLVAYVRATVLVAFIDAVGIGIFLVVFDIPFALPLAALVFLGAFIPIVGATLSGAVAVLVALVDSGWVTALIILGVVVGVQQIEGHILQPLIMGRAVALHPLAVVIAITAGVVLAGVVGALVSVPLLAVLNTAIRRLSGQQRPTPPPDSVVVAAKAPGS